MNVGKKIKELRKEREFTQEALAKNISSDARQISLYESNKYTPSAEVLVKLSKVLGVSVDYLLKENTKRVLIPQVKDKELLEQVEAIDKLDKETKDAVKKVLHSVIFEHKLNRMVNPVKDGKYT